MFTSFSVANMNSGDKLIDETRFSKDEKTHKKAEKKKNFSKTKINSLEKKTTQHEDPTSEDFLLMEEDSVKWNAVNENKREREKKLKKDHTKKIQRNHTKKLTERSKISADNERVSSKVEKENSGANKKKRKLEATEEKNMKDVPGTKILEEEKESPKDVKQTQTEKKKSKKESKTSETRKHGEEFTANKKKMILKDCIKSRKMPTSSVEGKTNRQKGNADDEPGLSNVNHGSKSKDRGTESTDEHLTVDGEECIGKTVISHTQRKIEGGSVSLKKAKQKKANYTISTNKSYENERGFEHCGENAQGKSHIHC